MVSSRGVVPFVSLQVIHSPQEKTTSRLAGYKARLDVQNSSNNYMDEYTKQNEITQQYLETYVEALNRWFGVFTDVTDTMLENNEELIKEYEKSK